MLDCLLLHNTLYGDLSFIDAQIGRLRTGFHRHQPEASENTGFIFTSDHGDMQGDHHLWRKTHAYEGSARVPLIVLSPPTHKAAVRSLTNLWNCVI